MVDICFSRHEIRTHILLHTQIPLSDYSFYKIGFSCGVPLPIIVDVVVVVVGVDVVGVIGVVVIVVVVVVLFWFGVVSVLCCL